jgi:hypothetical protein
VEATCTCHWRGLHASHDPGSGRHASMGPEASHVSPILSLVFYVHPRSNKYLRLLASFSTMVDTQSSA